MKRNFIKIYQKKSFEEKIEINALFSIGLNIFLAIIKTIITIFFGSFMFLISGGINLLIGASKRECYLGIKNNIKSEFKKRNIRIALLLIFSGLMYIVYMLRLVFINTSSFHYDAFLSINIAFVSFIEMGFAIAGILRVKRSGHYYRNIKIINLASACTAIILTQVSLLSFTETQGANRVNGLSGAGVGGFIVLLGIFILILPKASIIDREYSEYRYVISLEDSKMKIDSYKGSYSIIRNDDQIEIVFSNSRVYGKYYFTGYIDENGINGHLKHHRNFFKQIHWTLKILIILLSEILIFVWLIGRVINFIRNSYLPQRLDRLMKSLNCELEENLFDK